MSTYGHLCKGKIWGGAGVAEKEIRVYMNKVKIALHLIFSAYTL